MSVTLQVRTCRELETWVLGFGENASVARPERLAETIASCLKRAAENYGARAVRPTVAKVRCQRAEPAKKRGVR